MKLLLRLLLTLLLVCLASPVVMAQRERELTLEEKMQSPAYRAMMTVRDSALYIPEALDEADTTQYSWTERQFIHVDPDCISDPNPQPVPDSVYIMRLRALPTVIDMPFNQPVKQCLDLYLMRRRSMIERLVGIGFNHYFPIFEDALQRYELPSELKYLACIESALKQNAYSPARAAGLWQFIPSSGMMQGLEINSYIDERYDLYKSTDAACRFLKQLYNRFQDWPLAIAAYNCGPGNIDKAIARSGGRRTFWELYSYLPKETRSYVPLFIAMTYAMTYHCEHNLCGTLSSIPGQCDTLMVSQLIHFEQISQCLDIPIEQIESLNPQYVCDIVPGSSEKQYSLMLPADKAIDFLQYQDSIVAYKADSLLPHNGDPMKEIVLKGRRNTFVRDGGNRTAGANAGGSRDSGNAKGKGGAYTVKKGDTLGAIARKHHTTIAKIKKANGLRSDNVRIGQRLIIP